MNRLVVLTAGRIPKNWNQVAFLSTEKLPASQKPTPKAKDITSQNARFDQVTHTGQAWDEADYRLARFGENEKMVNPNIAAHLVAEQPPKACEERVVKCDGGHPALGHPAVFINLDKPGTHACGYCGQKFYNTHSTKPDELSIHHIQV